MELCTRKLGCTDFPNKIPDSQVKQCLQDYKLQDKVEALKNYLGIYDGSGRNSHTNERSDINQSRKFDAIGVKECLRPSVQSTFQVLAAELRDTVRSSYWNKEIGKTIYLVPHLPAGCDPLETTFGKATIRDEHDVAEILQQGDEIRAETEELVHALYRKSHDDYNPSEQVNRNYKPPFSKLSSFGGVKKADFSGKKVAKSIQWFNPEPMTLVSRRLAEYYNRTQPRVGRVRNREIARALVDLTFGKHAEREIASVADTLNETSASQGGCNKYCSEYGENISKSCVSWNGEKIIAAGLPSARTQPKYTIVTAGALRSDKENLGDQTSVQALMSPNIFTQMGLSHVDFFKVRDYKEIRSIFENIGIHFPGDSFDVLWKEGLTIDNAGGVCVETFRNLLPKSALKDCTEEST